MRKMLFGLLLIPVTSASLADDALSRVPYTQVREQLILEGWRPMPRTSADGCYQFDSARCLGYPEASDCAGTGKGQCVMRWQRSGEILIIGTEGEKPVVVSESK